MTTMQDRFYDLLNTKLGIPANELSTENTFEDLDLDSLALIELSVAVHKEFGVVLDETELSPEHTVGQVVDLLSDKSKAA
ncbi:MAG: acyl carrier protein [Pseudonocardiaceae bacterium]|nr:acyl carrier protein [Pseudonocardiaceae bacterium]